MDVDLRGCHVLVPHPQRDDGDVHPGVQQCHGRRVPQDVGRNLLLAQGWAGQRGGGCVSGDAPFQGVPAQRGAAAGDEQRVGGQAGALGEPGTQDRHGDGGERGDPLLAAFADAADVRSGSQVHVADGQAGELGGAQPGLAGQHEQGVVAPGPGALVGSGQQRGDLLLGEVGDQGLVEALGRDRQHTLDDRGIFGMAQRGVPEQRVDGRQPGVAGPGTVAAIGFQVAQERPDQWCVEIGDVQAGGRFAGLLPGEHQEQLEGVPVGGGRVAAGLALPGQPVGEERLQGGGEGAHEPPPRCASSRWPASAISSGAADRYQNVCCGSVWPR